MKNNRILNLLAILALLGSMVELRAQNTVVTYQGRVTDSGTNFNGTGQFKFALVTSTNANHTATAIAPVQSGSVLRIFVVDGGNGYLTPPTVTISGGGGSGATATASISSGVVASIQLDTAGANYLSQPTVIVSPPPESLTFTTYWSNDGTSSAGSEPAANVTAPVANGLFTVGLGDTTLVNMTAMNAALFQRTDLQLRIWFNDGVNGFAALSPLQKLTAAPYANYAYAATTLTAGSNQPLILTINGTNVLRIESVYDLNGRNTVNSVGGSSANIVSNGFVGCFIGGGGNDSNPNRVGANYASVLGGLNNSASGPSSTAMGNNTSASGSAATVMGSGTTAKGLASTAMGGLCTASGNFSTAMGYSNAATNDYTTSMGAYSTASGSSSTAMGLHAQAIHDRTFIWSAYVNDAPTFDTDTFFVSAPNGIGINCGYQRPDGGGQYWLDLGRPSATTIIDTSVGASLTTGGVWANASDKNRKTDFIAVNPQAILAKLAALLVQQWRYTNEMSGITHLGPTAQAFKAAFGLGTDDKSIGTVDADGVALAAIQGLNQKVEAGSQRSEVRIQKLETENAELKKELANLKGLVEKLGQPRKEY